MLSGGKFIACMHAHAVKLAAGVQARMQWGTCQHVPDVTMAGNKVGLTIHVGGQAAANQIPAAGLIDSIWSPPKEVVLQPDLHKTGHLNEAMQLSWAA